MNNNFDFNNLAEALKNGATDADIAKAFAANLNAAKAADDKRKAEEEKKAAAEAAKAENARLHRNKSMQFATDAATALNALLIHENVLHEGDVCFTAEDLIDTVDEIRNESANIRSLINSFGDLLGLAANPVKKHKNSSVTKTPTSDDTIFTELFDFLFK